MVVTVNNTVSFRRYIRINPRFAYQSPNPDSMKFPLNTEVLPPPRIFKTFERNRLQTSLLCIGPFVVFSYYNFFIRLFTID